jgi:hypothetical protein
MEKQLHVLGGGGGTLQQTRGTHRHARTPARNHTSRRPLHQNKRPQQYDDLTTVLETIKGSTRGRKRYAYCATQIHGAPPEMGITHLVEVMEPNGARHDRAALRLLWETSRAIQVTALNT